MSEGSEHFSEDDKGGGSEGDSGAEDLPGEDDELIEDDDGGEEEESEEDLEEDGREERREGLRRLGDTSLFVTGFFGDSLARSAVDPSYYVAMGERAYEALAASPGPAGTADLFGEMARRFEDLVDVLAEVAEMQDLRSNRGLVRLYERFLHTGSERVAGMLRARGVALFAGPTSRVVRS